MGRLMLFIGSVVGFAVSSLFNALLVVIKETNKPVKSWLASTFGHHWLGHGVLVILVFILGTVIIMSLYRGRELSDRLSKMLAVTIILFTILSVLIIVGFFAREL